MSVTHLIPKCPEELEKVMAHPFTLMELIRWLESKGVVSEPKLSEMNPEDARNACRVIYRELRMRENETPPPAAHERG